MTIHFFQSVNDARSRLLKSAMKIARVAVETKPDREFESGELSQATSIESRVKSRAFFTNKKVENLDSAIDFLHSTRRVFGGNTKRLIELKKFCRGLNTIGSRYTGKKLFELAIIQDIQILAGKMQNENSENKFFDLAIEVHAILAKVTKHHRKGFFAYLFRTKSKLEKLILACFEPLVKSNIISIENTGIQVKSQKTSVSLTI